MSDFDWDAFFNNPKNWDEDDPRDDWTEADWEWEALEQKWNSNLIKIKREKGIFFPISPSQMMTEH
jgi:hypothetical protein